MTTGLVVEAPGPADVLWTQRIANLPAWPVPSRARVLVLAAHPDDETLGLGGTLRLLADRDATIDLLVVTDGEGSHPEVPDLGRRRRGELRLALRRLGLAAATRVHHLGVADGEVARHEGTLAERVAQLAGPGTLLFAPWDDDGHTDHDAAGRAAASAAARVGCRAWAYPVWAWHWHDPATSSLLDAAQRVPLPGSVLGAKRRAVAAYRSQVTGELGAPIVPPAALSRLLRPVEVLVPSCV
jgi:LmbE family N-acetylglucosaminyl deacetylase